MFTLTIKTDNAAFRDDAASDAERDDDTACRAEIARILRDVARRVLDGDYGPILDVNGNKVGDWSLNPPATEEKDDA